MSQHVIVRHIERADAVHDRPPSARRARQPCTRRSVVSATSARICSRSSRATKIAGSAVTVLSHPGDNIMIHAAVEMCQARRHPRRRQHGAVDPRHVRRPARNVADGTRCARPRDRRRRARHDGSSGDGVPGVDAARVVPGHGEEHARLGQRAGRARWHHRATRRCDLRRRRRGGRGAHELDAAWALEQCASALAKEETMRGVLESGELGVDFYGLREKLLDMGVEYVD